MNKAPLINIRESVDELLGIIHTDVSIPLTTSTRDGFT